MPPSSDNICQQSSQFHFVNDFLYRPINAEEAQSRPNVTLRYADRYYPETYNEVFQDEETGENVRHFQQRQPPPQAVQPRPRPTPQSFHPSLRPIANLPQQFTRPGLPIINQVYHSPEEVNIPLHSRRPVASNLPQRGPPPTQPSNFEFDNE